MPNAAAAVSLVKGTFSRLGIEPPPPPPNPLAKYKSDLFGFAAEHLKILTKQTSSPDDDESNEEPRIEPLILRDYQKNYLSSKGRRNIILKARQMGFSTAIQADYFHKVVTGTAITATLSHLDSSTQGLRRMADRFYKGLPEDIRPKKKYSNATLSSYPLTNSEAMIATAGSVDTGRGGTYTHIHCSEVAFYPDAETIMTGILQGGSPEIVLESTANGAQGYFYTLCMEAMDGRNDWKFFFYPWWTHTKYQLPLEDGETLSYSDDELALIARHKLTPEQIKWRRWKRRELKAKFLQEYPEDPKSCFLDSGNGYFGNIAGCFKAPLDAIFHPDHRYIAGMDFAQMQDFTTCWIIDTTVGAVVASYREHLLPWETMRHRVAELCARWDVSVLVPEKNSMGSTNIEALHAELKALGCRARVVPFFTSNDSKSEIMSALHEALHSGALVLQDDTQLKAELNAFTATQKPSGAWQLAAKPPEHDDCVIALALAWYAKTIGSGRIAEGEAPGELSEWRG